jgi:hypothetical protein
MAVIYKYPIPEPGKPFDVKIKGFCEVVHAGTDPLGQACFWALVMPDQPEEAWTFLLVATGEEFESAKWCHLVSFQHQSMMWHLLRPIEWKDNLPKDVS